MMIILSLMVILLAQTRLNCLLLINMYDENDSYDSYDSKLTVDRDDNIIIIACTDLVKHLMKNISTNNAIVDILRDLYLQTWNGFINKVSKQGCQATSRRNILCLCQ